MIKYYEKITNIIKNSLESIDPKQYDFLIEQCTSVVKNGGKIIISGLGKNEPIAEKVAGTLTSLGIDSAFLNTNTAMHGDLGIVKDNDIVILLTKSSNTSESILLAKTIKYTRKTLLWLITFGENKMLFSLVDDVLKLSLQHEGDKWDLVPNNSTTVFLIVLQGIAMKLCDLLDVSLDDFKKNHPGGNIGEVLKNA